MEKISTADELFLLKRLSEIEGELEDYHISAYKSRLLINEKEKIRKELMERSFNP